MLFFKYEWIEHLRLERLTDMLFFQIYLLFFYFYFFLFIFISWRLITLQYCSSFCHTLTWISHGFTCIPHPDPPSHLPLHPIPLGLNSENISNDSLEPGEHTGLETDGKRKEDVTGAERVHGCKAASKLVLEMWGKLEAECPAHVRSDLDEHRRSTAVSEGEHTLT